ncbi:sodium- and chloride-dependent glycine transporter 1-like [Melitaea cinxia]|uniref:sodium- and chloride-dependent glycine transporter 1-like n=1 Tax=Melitaea cinxia TaxID=113334 RepID=UPI001E270514|nr:sodium- and chloride-dependent glycine transporter 1-like [Melitaea cinxia]
MASGNNTMSKTKATGILSENGSGNAIEDTPERKGWGRPLEFILACLGYAVGLGNVWRFPYLCYRNGGGAFFIPFLLMLVFVGLPIFYLELFVGQYTGLGPLKTFGAIAPFFSGVGYCTLVVMTIVLIQFMVIIAWSSFYTFMSIGGNIDWGSCNNTFNSINCFSGSYDQKCRENNTGDATDLTFYMRHCMSIGNICEITGYQPYDGNYCWDGNETVPWYTNVTRILASEEYFNEEVLGRGDATWEKWGTIQWHLVGCLAFSWAIAFLCVIKGVQSAGKVVYFTALFPYVMLTALVIRGVTLDGAVDGILFYLSPKWETLLTARVWGDAASQIFYSFGVACGSLVTLASYNKFNNNCHTDAIIVSFTNFFTSLYAGFAVFTVLGFLALQMQVSIDDVARDGVGLAFVVYPEALLLMPVPQLWSILFFFMLFVLGMGSQFAGIETINTSIVDQWPRLRKRYWLVTAGTCFSCFLLGLPMCFSGGIYLFTLLDWNTASWAILIIGMAEATSVSWSYGINRAMRDLASMDMKLNVVLRYYWKFVWTLTVPVASIAVLIFVFTGWTRPQYEDYVFPMFADVLGWLVGTSTLVFLPVGVCWALWKGYRGKELFTPTPDWQPQDKKLQPLIVSDDMKFNGTENSAYVK